MHIFSLIMHIYSYFIQDVILRENSFLLLRKSSQLKLLQNRKPE